MFPDTATDEQELEEEEEEEEEAAAAEDPAPPLQEEEEEEKSLEKVLGNTDKFEHQKPRPRISKSKITNFN